MNPTMTWTLLNTDPWAIVAAVLGPTKANQATLTVTGMPTTAQAYGATFTVGTSGGSGTGALTFGSSGACSVGVSSGLVSMTSSSGTCSVTATMAADANYNSTISAPATVSATTASQTITVGTPAPATAAYNGQFTVAGSASSGLPVAYTSSGGCTNSGATYTMTSPTTACSVIFSQAGNTDYSAATPVTETVTATMASQTITVTTAAPASAAYNSQFTVAATATSGLTVAYTSSGGCTNSGATYTMTSGSVSCTVNFNQVGNVDFAAAAQVTETVTATPGPATKLVFTTQPGGGTGGTAWALQPVVTVEDAIGDTVNGSTASITLAIGIGSGTLTCTSNPLSATAGVATFTGCKINKLGTGDTLTAASTGLTTATSGTFNVTVGAAAQLAFTAQPGGGTGGTAWTTQPTVTLQDAGGNTVTGTAQNVTLAIQNNAGPGGALSGTLTAAVNTSTGLATFSGLSINKSGTGYTLTATGSTVNTTAGTVVSSAFNITVGAATQLVFTTQPGGGTGGTVWTTQPVVTVEDAGGNTVSSAASIKLAIGTGNGALTCTTNPLNATAGVATFAGCKINLSGTNDTLTATSTGLTTATSNPFNITVGAAAQLVFTAQPGGGTGGTAWTTQPTVTLEDAGGNTVTGTAQNVTLAIQNNAGPGGALSGTLTAAVNTSTGVATFTGLSINKSGTGYTLTATGSTVDTTAGTVVSSAFNITVGAAAQLAFTTQPGGGTAATAWTTQPAVTLQDAGGNTVTGTAQNVTLAIQNNAGPGGTLSGTLTVRSTPLPEWLPLPGCRSISRARVIR